RRGGAAARRRPRALRPRLADPKPGRRHGRPGEGHRGLAPARGRAARARPARGEGRRQSLQRALPVSHEPMILDGKRILITGVINRRSIAFAIAEQAQLAGAEVVLTSFGRVRRMTERAAARLPESTEVLELDVNRDEDFERLRGELERRWGGIDGAVHAIAFAPDDALG